MATLREYCDRTLYEIDGSTIREYCGINRYQIDGFVSHKSLMALIAILFA